MIYDDQDNKIREINRLATVEPSDSQWKGIQMIDLGGLAVNAKKIQIFGQRNIHNGGFHIVEVDNIDPGSPEYTKCGG